MSSKRYVLVTGCSTGIGYHCTLELVRRGVHVFAGVRKQEDAERLRRECGTAALPVMLDVTSAEQIREAAQLVADTVGNVGLWGLVNNAGIVVTGPLEFLPLDLLRHQFEVNFFGQIALIQQLLPMLRTARGRIVNISSISGRVAAPYFGPYACSKFALEAASDSLRLELRRWGIQVAVVEPGNTDTPIWDKARSAADQLLEELRPRVAERVPEEVRQQYNEDFQAMREASIRMARTAMPVEPVIKAIMHALFARRPKTRYPVGWRARAAAFAFRFLPDRWRDAIVKRELHLP